jgi:hypothetical protein
MTYDENDDYNGPDTHRRGPFLFMAALVGVIVVAGFGAAVSDARADPNTQTELPADGVLSIERSGDVWSVTTDGIPSEVKLMSPVNQPICGVNYPTPCTNVTTFTVAADCTYWQVDGIPGFNSSDPYICLGGTPSNPASTPTAPSEPPTSPTPSPSPSSTSSPATQLPSPLPTPTSSQTSTPEPSSAPNPSENPPASTGTAIDTSTVFTSASDRLADTGRTFTKWDLTLLMGGTLAAAVGLLVMVRRTNP